jgi:hypothetical protein
MIAAEDQANLVARLPGSSVPGADEIVALLEDRPDIDLATVNLSRMRAELTKDDAELADRMVALARVYRMSPRFEHVELLLAAGLDSVEAICRSRREDFVARFGEQLGEADAVKLHRRACRRAARRARRRMERSRQSVRER